MPPKPLFDEDCPASPRQSVGDDDKKFPDPNGLSLPPPFPVLDTKDDVPVVYMTVMGIYTRKPLPHVDEMYEQGLSESHVFKVLKPEETMARRRMNTRPVLDNDEDNKVEEEKSEYETAMFVPEEGLVDSEFFHTDVEEHEDEDERIYEERAVLFQSTENYEELLAEPTMSQYFLPKLLLEGGFANQSPVELILEDCRFGEQVIVKGVGASDVAVGDIFEVEGHLSPLKVEVSSPRLPCAYVDKANGSPFGMRGAKRYTMTHGLAGWFTRVLVAGELRDGMTLVRTGHPHPKWTMRYLSKALYGGGDKRAMMKGEAHWTGNIEELRELCALEQLGRYEWKDNALPVLKKLEESLREQKQQVSSKQRGTKDSGEDPALTQEEEEGYVSWMMGVLCGAGVCGAALAGCATQDYLCGLMSSTF